MRPLFPTALVAASFAIAGCVVTGGCTPPRLPERTAVVLIEQQPRNLDPLLATDAVSQKIGNLVHAALLRFTPAMTLEGELAESWTQRQYRSFRFRLRPGLRFHDGSPLTSADVVRALNEYRQSGVQAVALAHVNRIAAPSALTVELETDSPQPFLLQDLPALKIFRRDGSRMIGAGRYRVTSESAGEIRATAASTYHEPLAAGAFADLVFRYVADDTTRYQHLMRGDANAMISALSLTKTALLRERGRANHFPLQVVDAPGINYSYLCFNLRDPKLADLRVRQAIAHAIDVPSLIKFRIGTFGYPATGILAPAHGADYEPEVERHAFDRARAEKLLDEAGFRRAGPAGWRFQLSFKTTTEKFGSEMARLLANELRQVGIDVRLDIVEAGTFFAQVSAGDFQLFHSRWVGVNSPAIFYRVFHGSQIGHKGLNRGAYHSAEMDRLLDAAMSEADDRRRRRLFSKVQKLAAHDLPYVSLWHWNNTFIGAADMSHVVMYPNGDYRTLEDLRVAK